MDDEQPGPRVGENPKRKAGRYTGVPHPEHSSRSSLIHLANSLLAIDELEAALPVVEAVVRHVDAGLWVPPEVVRLCEEAIGRLGERHALCEELRLRFYRGVANSTAFMREDMIGRLIDFWLKKGQHEEIKSFDEKSVKAWRMSDHPIVQGYRALDRFVRANEEAGAVAASHVHQALEQQRERPAEGTISSSERADDDMDVDGPASVPLRRFGELLHDESAGSCDLLEAYRDLRMDVEGTGVVLKAIVGYIEADRTPPPVFLRLAFLIERASDTCRDLFESCVRGNPSNMVALELLLVLLQEEALRQVLTQGLISPTERTRLEQYTREYIQRSGGDDESLILAYRARPALTPEAQLRIAAEFLECRPGSVVGWQEMSRCLWQSYTYMQLEVGEEDDHGGGVETVTQRQTHPRGPDGALSLFHDVFCPGGEQSRLREWQRRFFVPETCILGSLDVSVYPFLMFLAPLFVRGPPLLLFASYLSHKHPSCGPLVHGVMGPLKALPFPVLTAADTDQGDAAAASEGGHRSWALFATLYVHLRESESHTGVWECMPDNDDEGVTAASVFKQDECTRLFAAVDEALLVGQ